MSGQPRGANHIRKRPVSFGNPALGTYHGFVYTEDRIDSKSSGCFPSASSSSSSSALKNHHHHPRRPLIEGATEAQCLVAMLHVPPEQVPEGVLNLLQPHRPWIHHVRIVIAEPPPPAVAITRSRSSVSDERANDKTKPRYDTSCSPSPNASAMENAASILAAEQELETTATATATEKGSIVSIVQSRQQYTGNAAEDASATTMDHEEIQNHANSKNRQHDRPNRSYLVLIELCTEAAAAEMVQDLDGMPYTILEENVTCSVQHVIALQGVAGVSLMSPFFAPPSGKLEILPSHPIIPAADSSKSGMLATVSENETGSIAKPAAATTATSLSEDYNCAVCLEHMDLNAPHTSILTTVCNHSFHVDCLLQWQDSPCPVCRYDHSGLNEALSQCHLCGTTENNYVCLICGVVSCGGPSIPSVARHPDNSGGGSSSDCASRMSSTTATTTTTTTTAAVLQESLQASQSRVLSTSHARQHYSDTLHAYALCTETQHVWDFAGNGYVHRLLQNKDDGKLVEVNDPSNTTSHERTLSPGLSGAQEEQVVHRKLEGFANQYYTLLKSQLEQQRIYYQGRLEEIRREYARNHPHVSTSDWIAALRQEHHQLSQRLGSVQTKCRTVQEDVAFIKSLNEGLETNREPLREQVERAQRDRVEARKMFDEYLPPLEEKVTKLMLQLESSLDGGVGAMVGAVGDDPNTCLESAESSPKKPAAR